MVNFPRITLEQWRALIAVVETGGYAQAAAQLHKTQSSVTYAVQKVERVLGVKLFSLQGRRAVLTAAGEVLYRRGKTLMEQSVRLERAAAGLAVGWEPELRLAVDIVFPTWLLLECFAEFSVLQPETRIELIESVLAGTDEALVEGRVDLALGPWVPQGFVGDPILRVRFIAAAHPAHPLHGLGRPLTLEDLRMHRHLVVRDTGRERTRTPGWINEQRWTVSHKATAIQAACMGMGYAWYAEEVIRKELDNGALKPLPLREGAERWATMYMIFADRDAAGPGVVRMSEILRQRVAERCPEASLVQKAAL